MKLSEQMKQLAKVLDLQYDGGQEDNRLFDETVFTNSSEFSKKEYNAMEKAMNKFLIKGDGFEVGIWNDCSGYHYWNVTMCEDNYLQITVYVEDPLNIDLEQVRIAVEKARDFCARYERY